jgi:hypothetical protein
MIATAKKTGAKAKKGFHVRPGTVATCREVLGCSEPCAVLFYGLLEMWVEIPAKIVRQHDGENKPFLYLSGDNLATLTGRDKKTLQNTVIRELRGKTAFILIEQGKLTPDHDKGYRISINVTPLCEAIIHELQPFKEITQTVAGGGTIAKKRVDRAKLPYVFRRLYDEYERINGPFQP